MDSLLVTPAKSSGIGWPMLQQILSSFRKAWFITRSSAGLRNVHIALVSLWDTIDPLD